MRKLLVQSLPNRPGSGELERDRLAAVPLVSPADRVVTKSTKK
jgi:hypothetical protein